MRLRLAAAAALACSSAASAAPKPLSPDEAAIVGGWAAPGLHQVNRLYLAPIALSDGCLRIADGEMVGLDDHLTSDKAVFWKIHGLKPGRYALVGVAWGPPYSGGYSHMDWTGVSRQRGRVWTVEIAAGSVTYIGVWTIVSPYAQRYVIKDANFEGGANLAAKLAAPAGALLTASPTQAQVAEAKEACPATP